MTDQQHTGSRPCWVDDTVFPFESRFVEIDGNLVHYVDEGAGPTLLMLHGNPTWSLLYREVIVALRDRFRCVALDYPGFGLSVAGPGYLYLPKDHTSVVVGLLDRLELTEATLVAHDWGGPIGLSAVQQRPDVFERLVLTNTWAWPLNGDPTAELASRLVGGPAGRLLIRQFNLFVNAMIPAGHRRRKPTAAEMNHYRQALATSDRRGASATFARQITASRDFLTNIEAGLSALASIPTLIVWGDSDVAFGTKHRQRWEATFDDHHTVIAKGSGHFVPSDAPNVIATAIRDWIPAANEPPSNRLGS